MYHKLLCYTRKIGDNGHIPPHPKNPNIIAKIIPNIVIIILFYIYKAKKKNEHQV